PSVAQRATTSGLVSRPIQLLPPMQLLRPAAAAPPSLAVPTSVASAQSPTWPSATEALTDRYARPLRDLRLSVTDRCNFRCGYCMPKEVFGPGYAFLPRSELLTFEELFAVAQV